MRNLLAVTAVAIVPTALLTTPHLAIRRVIVVGAHQLNVRDLVTVTGIKRGQNLLLLRKKAAEQRARLLPLVEKARVCRIPPGTVRIDVVERKAVAVLSSGGQRVLIDGFGVPFRTVQADEKPNLRVITTDAPHLIRLGQPLRSPAVSAGLECLSLVARWLPKTTGVAVDAHLDMCLNIGAFKVRLGQPDQLRRKVALASVLLKHRPDILENGIYLDLSVPESPAWKPRNDLRSPDGGQSGTASAGL
ncbi:MAG: cell division protein FtsQ/DivIB [Armatimonadota bacterium]